MTDYPAAVAFDICDRYESVPPFFRISPTVFYLLFVCLGIFALQKYPLVDNQSLSLSSALYHCHSWPPCCHDDRGIPVAMLLR